MSKTCEKPFYKSLKVVLCKKPLEKTPNIREMRQVFKIGHLAKAIDHANYSLCKMVSLGQKFKTPKTCEKPFTKTLHVF
mgnify:CR=1 FL=1